MKKVFFLAFIATALAFSGIAQSNTIFVPQKNVRESRRMTYPIPQTTTAAYDSTTRFTQQFIKELNGVTYRIVLNECPYDGKRNDMLVYKMDREMPAILSMFNIAPNPKKFRVLVSDDNKKLVAMYEYNGEVKIIEFN